MQRVDIYDDSSKQSLMKLEPSEQQQTAGGSSNAGVAVGNDVNVTYVYECRSEYNWQLFEIPWEQLPKNIIEACEEGEQNKHYINYIVHMIINKMREVTTSLPTSAIKMVTKKLVERFPKTFQDLDEDGVLIGDGTHSIFKKLHVRNHYLNRSKKRPRKYDNFEQSGKQRVSMSAKTLNMALIRECDDNLREKLENSFPEQRNLLNENSSIEIIRKKCPILLTEIGAAFHFHKLTNSNMAHLEPAVEEKFNKFLRLHDSEDMLEDKPKLLIILEIVSRHFKEDINSIYSEFDDLPDTEILGLYPQIVKIGDSKIPNKAYYVYCEQTSIKEEGYKTFNDAFQMAFALYHNFSLKYPADISTTMEFVQRYFFKIHPDIGSKCNRSFSKVIRLINTMRKL